MNANQLFPEEEQAKIENAIAQAEKQTSGEVRVHIETYCPEEVLDRATYIFDELEMQKTELRNGVLIYLATSDHKFAIIGDAGINNQVEKGFWDKAKSEMQEYFNKNDLTNGLCRAAVMAGEQLSQFFPVQKEDTNELDNTISFGQ